MPWLALRLFLAYEYVWRMIMKKLLSILGIVLPAVALVILAFTLQGGKRILDGIYIIFPLIYLLQGALLSKTKLKLCLGMLISDAALLISLNLWYNMGSCIDLALIYTVLGLLAYIVKRIIKKSISKKKNREH